MGQRATREKQRSASDFTDSTAATSVSEDSSLTAEALSRLVTHSAPQLLQKKSEDGSVASSNDYGAEEERAAALALANATSPPRYPSPAVEMQREASSGNNVMQVKVNAVASKSPTRRLKPKAPSSYASSSVASGVSDSSTVREGGTSAKEPVGVRDFIQVKLLGKGSHGKVVLVKHRVTRKRYAMKILRKRDVIRRKQVENSKTELKVHMRFAAQDPVCPYITPLRWAFHTKSRCYMVFDYCSGGELYFHIGQRGKIPEVLARFYAAEIDLALAHLHELGIVYRDLKPENLMLDGEGHIYLVDFGLSKENVPSPTAGSKTFCGTTEYLAPEILKYEEHGTSVDYWSFGMLFYEMLTGLPPFYSYNQEEVVKGILEGDLDYPKNVMSDDAISLCKGLLDRNPTTRFGAAEIMSHPFFARVDWDRLKAKRIASRSARPPPPRRATLIRNLQASTSKWRGIPSDLSPMIFFRHFIMTDRLRCEDDAPAAASRLKTTPTADEIESQSSAHDSASEMRMVENELVESAKRALRVG